MTDGLFVVIRRIGQCGHSLIKNMAFESLTNRMDEVYCKIFDGSRRLNETDIFRKIKTNLNLLMRNP